MEFGKYLFPTILWLGLLIVNLVSLFILIPDLKVLKGSALTSGALNLILILISTFYLVKQIKQVLKSRS
jgi:predicted membrane-bound spermidine synthase